MKQQLQSIAVSALGLITKPANRLMMMAVLVFGLVPGSVSAQRGFVVDYTQGYAGGSVVTYGSLTNAQNGTDALSTSVLFPQRDLQLYLGNDVPVYGGDFSYILTGWSPSHVSPNSGFGNPNNTNVGFTQLYDTDASSVSGMGMFWTNAARTSFSTFASGSNTIVGCGTIPPQDCGRLWNGAGAANGGSFIEWSFELFASGLDPAVWNPTSSLYESASRPTSVSGSFSGIFHDAVTSQYYVFNWDINDTSWAYGEGLVDGEFLYGAESTVPEPATMTLLATGLAGMAAARKRRRKE